MDIRFSLAKAACKACAIASRVLGKNGSSLPGQMALKIDPCAIEKQAKIIKKKIIVVTGTNGKTSTNNILAQALLQNGNRVVSNYEGSNMLTGIATSLLLYKGDADYACFEVDEAYTRLLFKKIQPDVFLITNLFSDQADRFGKEGPIKYIREAIDLSPNTKLILNGNDPATVLLGENHDADYFIYQHETNPHSTKVSCPICGQLLAYQAEYYDHIGIFSCSCGYKSPQATYQADRIDFSVPGEVSFSFENIPYKINRVAPYHVFNTCMALSCMSYLKENMDGVQEALERVQKLPGRMEGFELSHPVILNMAKNPAGFNQSIDIVLRDERKKAILIGVNDYAPDGIDVSWIWDVAFEKLFLDATTQIILYGTRANALAVRMKYTDCPCPFIVISDAKKAIDALDANECDAMYILANYTATFELRDVLLSKQKKIK